MSITTHQRPGVYSDYEASGVVRGGSGGLVGLAAVSEAEETKLVTGSEQAAAVYGAGSAMARLCELALGNGARGVVCAPVVDGDYESAFEGLCRREDIAVMVCDSTDTAVQQLLKQKVEQAGALRRERIAVVGGAADEGVEALVERAAGLNSERMVLAAPGAVDETGQGLSGVEVAAAVAGAVAGQSDPAVPLGGAVLKGLYGLSGVYTDGELDLLILGGVTPVEEVGGTVSVVRAVTTRTTTAGVQDPTWRELSTVLIIDRVIPTLRNALRSKFRRAKNTPRGRGAIRAQVVLELENFLAREIITAYEGVSVTADESDPTRAIVEFSFTVAHGLNQIWLRAHISV